MYQQHMQNLIIEHRVITSRFRSTYTSPETGKSIEHRYVVGRYQSDIRINLGTYL